MVRAGSFKDVGGGGGPSVSLRAQKEFCREVMVMGAQLVIPMRDSCRIGAVTLANDLTRPALPGAKP